MGSAYRLNSYLEYLRDHPWAIVLLVLVIAAGIGLFVWHNIQEANEAEEFRRRNR